MYAIMHLLQDMGTIRMPIEMMRAARRKWLALHCHLVHRRVGIRVDEQAQLYQTCKIWSYKEVYQAHIHQSIVYSIPLTNHQELAAEDSLAARDDIRHARKLDRQSQKEALDELAPRADAGTRERALEKKREKTETLRAFGRAKSPGAVEEVRESELMGDDEGGIEGYRKQKKEFERKKNERELRKEEMLRARAAEREERVREFQVKEERTMEMLRALARQNYG